MNCSSPFHLCHRESCRKPAPLRCVAWVMVCALLAAAPSLRAAELSVSHVVMLPDATANVVVSGSISGELAFGVTILVELVPRPGAVGTVEFSAAPPSDITQLGDPWPGVGTFSAFDTDQTGSATLNGAVDDNGTFSEAAVTFVGSLAQFPIVASAGSNGVWDVVLSTSAGDSQWEGSSVTTTLVAGTVSVLPDASLAVQSLNIPPGATTGLNVSGTLNGESTFGVTILVQIVPRGGTTGTVTFTPAPPVDIVQAGDAWPGAGTFTAFDTNQSGSSMLNGSVDDNGTFVPASTTFSDYLTTFPVVASPDASGTWDVRLSTSVGDSSWEDVLTGLIEGTITVTPGACVDDVECDDGNLCTDDICAAGLCQNTNNSAPCDDGDQCTSVDTCVDGICVGTVVPDGTGCDDGDVCTVDDQCVGGLCAGAPLDCTTLDDQCGVGVCNPATGVCEVEVANEGGPCDDGIACTENDTCTAGVCAGTPIGEGGACDDGDPCTENDICTNDVCAGTALDCSFLDDACNVGVCDPGTEPLKRQDVETTKRQNNEYEGRYLIRLKQERTASRSGDFVRRPSKVSSGIAGGGVCVAVPINEGELCDDGDPCTTDGVCENGVCAGTPLNEGDPCDDSNGCTNNTTCQGGLCLGDATDCSGQDSSCTVGTCNPETGLCSAEPINEGELCDDGDLCTENEVCADGACVGLAVDCSHLDDQCVVGMCDPGTGLCEGVPVSEGGTCDDGDACTLNDVCTGGVCAGTPADCGHLNSTCSVGQCNATTGECEALPINEGGACNDNSACTTGDVCTGGACVGAPKDCSHLNDACNVGTCNPSNGVCGKTPANDGGGCDDGYACTTNDVCSNGVCAGTLTSPPTVNLTLTPSSQSVSVGGTFFVDLRASSGTCIDQPTASAEVILTWDPSRIQLTGFSNPGPHSSSFPDDSDLDGLNAPFSGIPSNDGDALYLAFGGFTGNLKVPPSGMLLTRFQFTALTGTTGTQLVIPPSIGSFTSTRVLGAGTFAGQNITGTLDAADIIVTECQSNGDCDDGNVCTTDVCTPDQLCAYTNNTLSCDDGLFCTANDVCSNGTCTGSGDSCPGQLCNETLNACVECLSNSHCDDGNPCTNNVCNAQGACTFPNNTAPCNDGLFCTSSDVCSGGACVGSGDRCPGQLCDEANDRCVQCLSNADCNDNNLCTDDSCNTGTGQCVFTNNTLPCNDGLFCTLNDVCTSGSCVGSGDRCPGQICNESADSCVNCIVNADCPPDGNECTDDRCIGGDCFYVNHTRACNDGQFCTATDNCLNGSCVGSGDPCSGQLCDEPNDRCVDCLTDADCNDGISCTADSCNVSTGVCTNAPNNGACSDGLFCTGAEVCDPVLGCVSPGNPCDDPSLCNETTDTCGCSAPTVTAVGGRYFRVTPAPGSTPVAIRISGTAGDSRVSCLSLRSVQANGTVSTGLVFRTPSQWGSVHVGDTEIIPSATYIVRSDCRFQASDPQNLSEPVMVTTWKWGDVNNDGNSNFADVSLIIDGFRGVFTSAILQNVDLHDCVPNRLVNFSDVSYGVDSFRGLPYPCAVPCP
jgi:hypothetical protein